VFEKSPRPGGRVLVEEHDGFLLDAGAQYLLGPDVFKNTFGLIRDLDMSADLTPIQPVAGQLYKGSVYHHRVASATGLLHFKGINILDKALLPKMALLLSRYGETLSFQRPELGLSHDDESVAEFIRREFSQNILNYIAGPLISTLFFYGSHETSKLLYLLLAKHMQRTEMFTLRKGIGSLAERLAQQAAVRTNTSIDGVRRVDGDYLINGERFSDVVVAVRGDSVLKIRGIEELLPEEDRTFLRESRYERAVTVFVATDRPIDGACYGVSIPSVEGCSADTIAFHDYIAPSRVPAGAGLLAITGGGPDVNEDTLLADLRYMYGAEKLEKPRFIKTYEWPAAMPKFPPGRFRQIEAFRARKREISLCGDYMAGPFVESALASGFRAAEELQSVDNSSKTV
jgi:protoporphyrinogen oxidase